MTDELDTTVACQDCDWTGPARDGEELPERGILDRARVVIGLQGLTAK